MARTLGAWSVLASTFTLVSLTGCGDRGDWGEVDDGTSSPPITGPGGVTNASLPTLFEGRTIRASSKVAPVAGGTLTVTSGGLALAADPDRDALHVVDLAKQSVVTVALAEGDEPGRVVEGPAGTAYVAARRGGVVAAVDLVSGAARRISVCAAPRGLAYDAASDELFVACRSGLLVVVDGKTDTVKSRRQVETDLRDVVLADGKLVLTRFKSAEVLVLTRDGQVLRRHKPQGQTTRSGVAAVAYRSTALPGGGGVLVGHVEATNTTLPSGAGAYYGAPCGGSVTDSTLTAVDVSTGTAEANEAEPATVLTTMASHTFGGVAGPLDIAISPDGARAAALGVGNSWSVSGRASQANLFVTTGSQITQPGSIALPCAGGGFNGSGSGGTAPVSRNVPGEPVAVAFDLSSNWVVQSRQPAQLELENGTIIPLAADQRFDTGFVMFHMNTGGGVSCTSCHPEAGEDGHTWSFTVGPRRSQALEGRASARSPFHWEGDLGTFDKLFDEVMMKRMTLLANVTGQQRDALRDWLDSVPYSKSADDLDVAAVERGKELFENKELACSTCHGGADFTDNLPHDVGTGSAFVTPSLRGVGVRAPLFHDGCATTLEGRFNRCGGGDAHGVTSHLTAAEESDLVAFMRSL